MHTTSLSLSLSFVSSSSPLFSLSHSFSLSLSFKFFPFIFSCLTFLCPGSFIFLSSVLVPQNGYISPPLEPPAVTV
ncbi:hypothetical protein IMY05_010G0012800 [Salix suchowensis]|nr:hypothetical protein IMY05_010G0012800 [Salix suchowensis]